MTKEVNAGPDAVLARPLSLASYPVATGRPRPGHQRPRARVRVIDKVNAGPGRIYCATANPTQVIVAQTELGRGVLGVVDGASPSGVETDADIAWRKDLLRKLGYKL